MAIVATAGLAGAFTGSPAGAANRTAPLPASGFNQPAAVQAEQALTAQTAAALGLAGGEELKVRDVIKDADGTEHVRYNRTYNGLRVVGGDLIVERKRDAIKSVDLQARRGKVGVAVHQADAVAGGRAGQGHEVAGLKASSNKGTLVVFAATGKPVLAYEVVTSASRPTRRRPCCTRSSTPSPAPSSPRTTRSRPVPATRSTPARSASARRGSYSMTDPSRGGNFTTDLNGATSGNGTTFTDPDDTWGNGTTASRQTAGADAHYGAQLTWDYYKNVHGRNGILNNGLGARSRVHYGNAYVNAFWDGSLMTYGDGSGNAKPLTSIDVAGHEMSHGVTEATANLDYSGDAGGLNEATSRHLRHRGGVLREQLLRRRATTSSARRSTSTATARRCATWTSRARTAQPRTAGPPARQPRPALLLRPANHWFYLASEGSGAKVINGVSYNSPTCDGSTVDRHRPRQGRQDLVPRAEHQVHLRQHLHGRP